MNSATPMALMKAHGPSWARIFLSNSFSY